ncbi:B-cell receptor CD22-like isoform X2 [Onychostoma macrolepis]|uniref:B-cell receptor CD22-like isoform X2 n=1 Tax=Onychostoma macrolepis TaxID=369639 RepID=UPI00272B4E1B|nr:B-cell receptor CD22-like isoform X2 [Onychostoma macrolepis]
MLMSFIHASLTQERPKPVVKVTPDQRVFSGETVTLTCDIQPAGHIQWRYSWFKDGDTQYPYTTTTTAEFSFTASVSDSGEYSCRGERSDSQRSDISAAVTLTVSDSPTSTLTVTPNYPVFTGETVNLTCVIESHSNWRWRNSLTYDWRSDWTPEWRYEWYKDSVMLQTSDRYTVNRDTLTIRGATESDQGQYWCRGQRDERPKSSQSSSVSLSVKDLPRSTLTVTPDSPVFTGETVNLTCAIESGHSDWRYEWFKGSTYYSSKLQPSDRYTVNRDTLTIRGATVSDQDRFWCRGQIRSVSSYLSSAVYISVKDSPRSTLTVTPDNPVFTGETVNLTCVIESHSNWRRRNSLTYVWRSDWTPEWRYEWYKDTDSVMLQTSDRYTVNRDTLTIRGATESDQGQYWCRGQRDERPKSSQSSSVSLSVNALPRSTLTVTPDSPAFTGKTVNLTCVIESHSDWRYEWFKGGNNRVMLQSSDRYTVNRETLTIRGATESKQGQYWCRGQRDERPKSSQESNQINLSVNAASSRLLVTGVVLGLWCLLIFISLLLLLWRYKKNKDQQRNINQTSVPNQSGESQPENSPLQSADPDHIYDDVTEVKKRHKDDPESYWEVIYSEVTVQKEISVDKDDRMAESNEVTYSEVRTKVQKCKSKGP